MTTTQPTVAEMEARVMEWLGWTRIENVAEFAPKLWQLVHKGEVCNVANKPFSLGSDLNTWADLEIYELLAKRGILGRFLETLDARSAGWPEYMDSSGATYREAILLNAKPAVLLRSLYELLESEKK